MTKLLGGAYTFEVRKDELGEAAVRITFQSYTDVNASFRPTTCASP